MAIEKEKIFYVSLSKSFCFFEEMSYLTIGGIVAKTDSDGAGFQCSCTFMGQGRTMQTRTHRDPLPGKPIRRFLAINFRHKGHHAPLMRP